MLQYLTIIFVSIRSNNGQLNWAVAPFQWHYVKTHISHWHKSCHDVNFVFMTTSYATSNDKAGIIVTHVFQWSLGSRLTAYTISLWYGRSQHTDIYNTKTTKAENRSGWRARPSNFIWRVFCRRMSARYREFIGRQWHNIIWIWLTNSNRSSRRVILTCPQISVIGRTILCKIYMH